MEINSLKSESTLVAHLSKGDLKFFEKNPFGNIATKPNNKGIRIILSLGEQNSASVNENIISLVFSKEKFTFLSKSKMAFFHLSKNLLGLSRVEVYLETI